MSELQDSHGRIVLGLDAEVGIVHLGLDSEGTGRTSTNLLLEPAGFTWNGAPLTVIGSWERTTDGTWTCRLERQGEVTLALSLSPRGEAVCWRWQRLAEGPAGRLCLVLSCNALLAPVAVLPQELDAQLRGIGRCLFVAPDLGHVTMEGGASEAWSVTMSGERAAPGFPAGPGLDPTLRGQDLIDAIGLPGYRPGTIGIEIGCDLPDGSASEAAAELLWRCEPLQTETPLDGAVWDRIRRPFLNHWQPCSPWSGHETTQVLANNVLSDPAACSLFFYADPMLFVPEPAAGVCLHKLLRHSLDYYFKHSVSAQGHVNAFMQMYDLYVITGAHLVEAAWDYWVLTHDREWLAENLPVIHRVADYLARRDVDGDGLIESLHGGVAGRLREPDRADVWFELMHFGHKNAYLNAHCYRAFLCVAEMLEAGGHPGGAEHYRGLASALRSAYVEQLLSAENGWFVSWISIDGEVHDYCHTFVNGLAVAYGLVPADQGREILQRVVDQSKRIGFENWHLGVPGNLIPCRVADLMQPPIDLDGRPVPDFWGWPEQFSFTDEQSFGKRYPDGTIHPPLVWPYVLGLQVAGLNEEADRILEAMAGSADRGLFQNGIVNVARCGAEHFTSDGLTCGYEGYLPESYNFLMGFFTRDPDVRRRLLSPMLDRV